MEVAIRISGKIFTEATCDYTARWITFECQMTENSGSKNSPFATLSRKPYPPLFVAEAKDTEIYMEISPEKFTPSESELQKDNKTGRARPKPEKPAAVHGFFLRFGSAMLPTRWPFENGGPPWPRSVSSCEVGIELRYMLNNKTTNI